RKKLDGSGFNIVRQDKFKYHEGSWNMIMPVIKKLFGIQAPIQLHETLSNALTEVDFKRTYQAIVEFVKWHNENK
ncbi:MAG: hypothetical protein ACFFKA_19880, partial [Candidatus Thorarchaeota archaeon]